MSARLFWHLPYPAHWLVAKLLGWEVVAWLRSSYAAQYAEFEYQWRRVNG